jgi:uncharacterized protein (TIGR02588 family)
VAQRRASGEEQRTRPLVEWIAGGIGLVLTLALLGFVGWQAVSAPGQAAPAIAVRVTAISPQPGGGHVVEIAAANRTAQTAAGVEVEGTVTPPGGQAETSTTTFDYVPGHSEAHGGLFFTADPAAGVLTVRAMGYRRP